MNTYQTTGRALPRPTRTMKMILEMDGASRDDIREALGPARADFDRCLSYLLWQGFCQEVPGTDGARATIVVTEKGRLFLHLIGGLEAISRSNSCVAFF